MPPEVQEHLKIVQSIIARQATNSFVIRGWCITVVTALYAYALVRQSSMVAITGILAAFMFGYLDVYYLRQERLWRGLYELIRTADPRVEPFSLSTVCATSISSTRWSRVATSAPLGVFFGTALLIGVIVVLRVTLG